MNTDKNTVQSRRTLTEQTFSFNVFEDYDVREVAENVASEFGLLDWTATKSHEETRLNTTFEVWTITGLSTTIRY